MANSVKVALELLAALLSFFIIQENTCLTDFNKKNVFSKVKPRIKLAEHTDLNLMIICNLFLSEFCYECMNFTGYPEVMWTRQ